MRRASLPIRVFVGLLIAVVPALLFGVATDALASSLLLSLNAVLVAVGALAIAIAWAIILTVVSVRSLSDEATGLVALARHGDANDSADADGAQPAYARMSSALEGRNRQLATLASATQAAPITGDPRHVASHVVQTARSVTGDPTWMLAVVRSNLPEMLPTGVYDSHPDETPVAIGEVERWSITGEAAVDAVGARKLEGPWGAFLVVDVAHTEDLSVVLLAPWEGRGEPFAADLDLLSLLGQHAGTALEHALLYSRVRAQAEELDRMAHIQADFLRGVTHDLQTPLTSIAALASNLRVERGVPTGAEADLDAIAFQAGRLRRMVAQLLTMSGLEAGVIRPRVDVFRTEPLVTRVWQSLRPEGRALNLASTGPPRLAIGDPDRLEQVLWAVLENAIKYSPDGEPIEVTLAERASEDSDTGLWEEIRITDHGMGMDRTTLGRAFEQFYRADAARRLAPDGSGIGLYTAAGLVRLMGGELVAESSLGEGASMTISLPAELAGPG